MDFNSYQKKTAETAIYEPAIALMYLPLKLAGEAGEVAEKIGKTFRAQGLDAMWIENHDTLELAKELGDVLWYVARLADELGFSLNEVAEMNLRKLNDRKDRGVLEGNGDNR